MPSLLFYRHSVIERLLCFCEEGDILSQWRGYADNRKGCSLGFSVEELQNYCNKYKNAIVLKQVEYKTLEELDDIILKKAEKILNELKNLRNNIKKKFAFANTEERVDNLLWLLFHQMVMTVLLGSLKYKDYTFNEEKEWRIFFIQQIYKTPKHIYTSKEEELLFCDDAIKLLRNKIEFKITDKDIIPFCPIEFDKISVNPIKEVITGPKNEISQKDFLLFASSKGLPDIKFSYSKIPFR